MSSGRRPLLLLLAAVLLGPSPGHAARRVLHVSLYPYIPEAPAAALALKQGYEQLHPEVIVQISLNRNYYSPKPDDKGLLHEDADVHEIDSVFMRDMLDHHAVQPVGAALAATLDAAVPLARQAAVHDGTVWAIPHWMCTDFLIYRADQAGLGSARTLGAVEAALGPTHGLLLNMAGADPIGELYLTALLAGGTAPPAVTLAHLSPRPDPAILGRLRRLLALEPAGMGRNPAYGATESFYPRQFARRAGSAFVGYSEQTHDVLEETGAGCRIEDRCVTADQIRVTALPLADGAIRPAVWVDLFAIDARVHGRTLTDAQDFIRYAVSLPAYRALLIPAPGEPPRYLLPGSAAAFDDPAILRTAPLYPAFRAILDRGVVVTAPHLGTALHDAAGPIDAALPPVH